jgi:hypothetical protein
MTILHPALVIVALAAGLAVLPRLAAESIAEEGLKEVPLRELSSNTFNFYGRSALALNPDSFRHAESANFTYHYFDPVTAKQVAVEAEFFFRVIAADLGREGEAVEKKAHIFMLPDKEWAEFKRGAQLDPWTGGMHTGNELFIPREGERPQGPTLGHEVAHLVVDRFFGDHIPLWLNEGYAEYISGVLYAAYYRARKYVSKPRFASMGIDDYIPVERLTAMTAYPANEREVAAFYVESRKLVTFLQQRGKEPFRVFFGAMAKGNSFDSALQSAYAGLFGSRREVEDQFRAEMFKSP